MNASLSRRQLLGLAAAASAGAAIQRNLARAPMRRLRPRGRVWRCASTPCLRTCPLKSALPK